MQNPRSIEMTRYIGNVTDMELTSGINWIDTCNLGDVNKYVNDMEVRSESRQMQNSKPIEVTSHIGNATDMELSSGINWIGTHNPGDVNKYIRDMQVKSENREKQNSRPIEVTSHIGNATDMELTSGINWIDWCNPGDVDKYVSDMEVRSECRQKQTPRPIQVSSHIGNATDMELTNGINWTETKHSEHIACNSSCPDKSIHNVIQSVCAEAETSPQQVSVSEEFTVHALGSTEKLKAKDNSVTLVRQCDTKIHNPFPEITLPNMDGRCCEQIRPILDVEKVNESTNWNSLEVNVENHISSKTSVPALGSTLSIPSNMKKSEKRSHECDTKLSCVPKLNQESVNGSIQNIADKLNLSQGINDLQNSESSYKKVTKTPSQEKIIDSTGMFTSCKGDSFLMKELGSNHEHTIMQSALNEDNESSDAHMRILSELQEDQTVKQLNTAAPTNSTESTEMKQNLQYSPLQSPSTSMPDEMEWSIIKDLSSETSESYNKLVQSMRMADRSITQKVLMASNNSFDNSRSAQSNSEERALLPQELNNSQIPMNEPVTMEQEIAEHLLESETVTRGQNIYQNQMFVKSCVKQTDEQIKQKELGKDTKDNVAMSSMKEPIKAKEMSVRKADRNINSENPMNEPVTMEQEIAEHLLESETVTRGQNIYPYQMFVKSCVKQTDEQIKPKELGKDTKDVVAMSSMEEQIKAKEMR
jgi:hypothetical protein